MVAAARNGPDVNGLGINEGTLTLKKQQGRVPGDVPVEGGAAVKPFHAGETVAWALVD